MRIRRFWSVDSEFIYFGKRSSNDVSVIAFSDGYDSNFLYRNADDARKFLEHKRLSRLHTWTLRPEFGSFVCWRLLGVPDPTMAVNLESETIQRFVVVRPSNRKTLVLDIQPFFKPLGLGSLAKTAKFLSEYYKDPSLVKVGMEREKWFGKRHPKTETEWRKLEDRCREDAKITSRAAEFLACVLLPRFLPKVDLKRLYSWGTISRRFFKFPQVNARMGKTVIVKNWHWLIHTLAEFAGRSEAFSVGRLPPAYYLDVASLYPISVVSSDAFRIADIELMTQTELDSISKPDDFYPYCWLDGIFETQNGLWGLPCRTEKRNYYVVGQVSGLFHSLDLLASKAKIVKLRYGFKPVFTPSRLIHDAYAKLTLQKLEGRYIDLLEKHGIKQIVNDALGSLGMSKPQPSSTSNFLAYSTGLAMSHLIMSRIFDLAQRQTIHYCDTDSIFVEKSIEGKAFDLTDLEKKWTVPVVLEEKGFGESPLVFRSKLYYLNPDAYATQAIVFERSDWLKIVQDLPDIATAQRQITGTIRTRAKRAKELQFGRWFYDQVLLQTQDLARVFKADEKRVRPTYDSYALCREGRFQSSKAWTADEFYKQKIKDEDLAITFPSGKKIPREYVRNWLENIAKTKQAPKFVLVPSYW